MIVSSLTFFSAFANEDQTGEGRLTIMLKGVLVSVTLAF